ncbi:hypothetical protein AWZ03_000978 [Drosophila navojoa]|uniref:trypsin n=1 Tax=Drosophila navojoa TaxID=7232 RepID=A0A484BXT3_DRONA|nr:uncharacterized protein LOC115563714 [Drosophila navojoa]TDG52745.1 hypothetical protein AWZ03_000978 [Drosophila navojoa]
MWLKLITWLTLLQLLAGALSQEFKIFGGKTESVRNYPFLVNLRQGSKFACGGALIAPSCVVTAAHCLGDRGENVNELYVNAQQDCLNGSIPDAYVRQAWYACVAPQYKPSEFDADLAVIKLRQPFYTSDIINTIAVDFNEPPEGASMRIVGWGMTSDVGQDLGQCLQSADVSVVPRDQCNRQMSFISPITNNMFCALGPNKIDSCSGDSGGPILYKGRPVGVVSWGNHCGSGLPGVYTRFSSSAMMWFLQNFIETHCLDKI